MTRTLSPYEFLIRSSSDAILRIGSDGLYLEANPAATALLGMNASELIGKPLADIGLPQEMTQAWDEAIRSSFERAEAQTIEFRCNIGQRAMHLRASVVPECGDRGQAASVLAVIHDMSKRDRMEKEHQDLLMRERSARIQAETAARARDEFLAIVSHELRAPLNAIQTWSHLLETQVSDLDSDPPGLARRALTGIKTGVSQQVRLIDDLLDVTRMMSGKLRLIKHPLAVIPVVQAAVQSVMELASTKGISIECALDLGDEKIEGDADRIQQILWNLLANAVKFTPQGGCIQVKASREDGCVVIAVTDNGIGISSEFLPQLFNRFSQEDTSSTRRHNGLGLGLYLVRYLVEMHGGTVRAESAGDKLGARFSIELPLHRNISRAVATLQAEALEHTTQLPSLTGLRIVLIDDQEEARESLSMVLSMVGATVFTAATFGEIVGWLNSLRPEQYPNVIISDIAMPVEDGYTVLRKLRNWKNNEDASPLQRVPALALTAFAQREDRIRALTAGFQRHVAKPVAPEELILVIAMMAGAR